MVLGRTEEKEDSTDEGEKVPGTACVCVCMHMHVILFSVCIASICLFVPHIYIVLMYILVGSYEEADLG